MSERYVTDTFITECPPDGFRARCVCGWAGDWRGYDIALAEDDATEHEESAHG